MKNLGNSKITFIDEHEEDKNNETSSIILHTHMIMHPMPK